MDSSLAFPYRFSYFSFKASDKNEIKHNTCVTCNYDIRTFKSQANQFKQCQGDFVIVFNLKKTYFQVLHLYFACI